MVVNECFFKRELGGLIALVLSLLLSGDCDCRTTKENEITQSGDG